MNKTISIPKAIISIDDQDDQLCGKDCKYFNTDWESGGELCSLFCEKLVASDREFFCKEQGIKSVVKDFENNYCPRCVSSCSCKPPKWEIVYERCDSCKEKTNGL